MSDINSILKNLDWNTRRPFGWSSSPDADWKVIFIGTVSLIVFVSILNLVVFVRVDKGKFFVGEEVITETLTLNTEKLKKTLTYYQNKAAEFKRFTSGGATVIVDPSL